MPCGPALGLNTHCIVNRTQQLRPATRYFLAQQAVSWQISTDAKALRVPTPRINDIVRERRGITADTAMRLARYFGGDAQSWLDLQTMYDLRIAVKAS